MIQYQFIAAWAFVSRTSDWGLNAILRRCAVVSRLLFLYPVAFSRIVNALATPKLLKLTKKEPIIFIKFSWPIYAHNFSVGERAALFSNHYKFLQQRFTGSFLNRIIDGRVTIWDACFESTSLRICMAVSYPATLGEGELNLHFQVNSADVYVLSFVIVPNRFPGSDLENSIFVTRLQGTKGCANAIRLATKSVGDVSPPLILMAAVQGIAMALAIRFVLGINAKEQLSSDGRPPTLDLISAYDEFWDSIEGKRLASGLFQFPIPLPEKPLALIKQNHRTRVRSRRAFRNKVTERVCAEIEDIREP